MSISKETLHPKDDNTVDIYPKTSSDQVEGIEDYVKFTDLPDELEDYQKKIVWTKTQYTLEETVNSIEYNVINPNAKIVYVFIYGYINNQGVVLDVYHNNIHWDSSVFSNMVQGVSNNIRFIIQSTPVLQLNCRSSRYLSNWAQNYSTGSEHNRTVTNMQKVKIDFNGVGLDSGVVVTIYEGV